MMAIRDTYKYKFKVGNLEVYCGITYDLTKQESEHQNSGKITLKNGKKHYWSKGHIVKVGNVTTRKAAMKWVKLNEVKNNF